MMEGEVTEVLMVQPPVAGPDGEAAKVRIGRAYLCGREECEGIEKALKDDSACAYRRVPAWQLIDHGEEEPDGGGN